LKTLLQEELKLELSEAKTLITHARTETARFLNYEIHTIQEDSKRDQRDRRSHNGTIGLRVPQEVIANKCQRYTRHNRKGRHRPELTNESDFSIIALYQSEYRGLVEYYRLAYNLHTLTKLEGVMETSLTKTLAVKYRISVSKVYEKYRAILPLDKKKYKVLQVTIEREGKKPLVARWGAISLHWDSRAAIKDEKMFSGLGRSELEKRLLADTCAYCGTTGDKEQIEVHPHQSTERPEHLQRSRETSMGEAYGRTKAQNNGVMHYLPPGCHLWKANETKASVCSRKV
jgi:hypothetical protein